MHNYISEQQILSNKFYNAKKNSSSLLSTSSSSVRGKKIKLRNDFSPFNRFERMNINKKYLDFPICISIFTNNISINEHDINININTRPKLNLKFANIDTKLKDKNKFNKKVFSRNHNSFLLNSNSKNSNLQNNYSIYKKYPFSELKSDSKLLLNKINYTPLPKFTQQNFFSEYKNNNNNVDNLSNLSLEQDLSIIKTQKNTSNSIVSNNKKINLVLSPRKSESFEKEKISELFSGNNKSKIFISPNNLYNLNSKRNNSQIFEINKLVKLVNESKIKNYKLINNDKTNSKLNINDISNIDNIKENIESDSNLNINKRKINLDIKNTTLKEIKKFISNKEIIKINKIIEKENKEIKEKVIKENKEKEIKEKVIKENNEKEIKENESEEKIRKEKEIKYREIKKDFQLEKKKKLKNKNANYKIGKKKNKNHRNSLIYEKYNLDKIKENKFYFPISNKKKNDKYKSNEFLNEIKEKLKNNSINMKLFIQKSEMLIKFKEKNDVIINHVKNKVSLDKKDEKVFFSLSDYKYSNKYPKNSNDNNNSLYNNLGIKIIKKNEYLMPNCKLSFSMKNYFLNICEFDNIASVLNEKNFINKNNLIKFNSIDHFLIQKSNYNQKFNLNIFNLININEIILKSLPFYREIQNINNNKKIIRNKNNLSKPKYTKKVSKVLKYKTKTSDIILSALNKKNSIKSTENEKELINKNSSLAQEFIKNLKKIKNMKNLKKKNDKNINDYSILKRKYFFKNELRINKAKELQINEIDEQDNINDADIIYLELIRLLVEAENKSFIKFFEKNKEYIDINEELFDGNSLLILATREGNFAIAKFLCEQGVEVNNQNQTGNTALHYAIGKHFYDIADLLVRFGAREDIRNKNNFTVWECMGQNINFNY